MKLPGIIIARGGSKRIPRKNVKDFCGRPLVEWTIIQAKDAQGLDPVVLITDDYEIAEIGKKHGIMIFMRPTTVDNVAGSMPFNQAINRLEYMGYKFDSFVSLLPTGPLRLPGDIDKGITIFCTALLKHKSPQTISMVRVSENLISSYDNSVYDRLYYKDNEMTYGEAGLFSIHTIKMYRILTQTHDHIGVLRMRRKIKRRSLVAPYIVKAWQGVDIDTPEQFELCEMIFKHYILDKGYYK